MVELHVTWEQVDEMTLPQVQALGRHFKKLPPLRVSVAAVAASLGVDLTRPESAAGASAPAIDFAELPEFE